MSSEANVVNFPSPESPTTHEDDSLVYTLAIINASIRVLNARMLCILALLGAIGIWVLVAIDPSSLRVWAAGGYALSVLFPTLFLYSRKS
jgi:hypothetical protein